MMMIPTKPTKSRDLDISRQLLKAIKYGRWEGKKQTRELIKQTKNNSKQ